MKKILHTDFESVGGFNRLKAVWSAAWIVTDAKGTELYRKAYLISEALPFLAGDTFWSQRKNGLMIQQLGHYETVTAAECWADFQADMNACNFWVAFNSRFEAGCIKAQSELFRVPEITLPPELDLALYAFDVLPISKYAAYALEHGFYSDSRKSLSSKCEHLLTWLVADGRMENTADHSHLALDDTISQVALYRACLATKGKRPEFGKRLSHIGHPMWRKFLRLTPDADKADGNRYTKAATA